ncbi:hypothetical protein EON65_51240 [archaeon]|nr:MAG: hypothetical protein EON65_51240 [archaeon]
MNEFVLPDIDPSAIIRPSIRETVDSLQWLEKYGSDQLEALNRQFNADEDDSSQLSSRQHELRCMICTLPYGSCEHSPDWLTQHEQSQLVSHMQSDLQREIDSVLDLVKFEPLDLGENIDTSEIDLEHMQWLPLPEERSDKLGAEAVKLFVPDKRAWHSTVNIDDRYVVVFGGFQSK